MPRRKKCPGCGEDQAIHKPGTANKHCEGLPTLGLPPSAKKGEETSQGPNLEALQQRKLDLQRALEAKKLQAEIDELEKQLAGDAPADFGDKKNTGKETTPVDKQNTGEESTPVDKKNTGEESTLEKDLSNLRLGAVSGSPPAADLGKDDVTLDQLRQNNALQRAVETKFEALAAPAKSGKAEPRKSYDSYLSPAKSEQLARTQQKKTAPAEEETNTNTSKKHEMFIKKQRLGEEPTNIIPGVGKAYAGKLAEKGFTKAKQIVARFRAENGDEQKFKGWLKQVGLNAKCQDDCYTAVKEWCEKYPMPAC